MQNDQPSEKPHVARATGTAIGSSSAIAIGASRYSIAHQFLRSSTDFANRAAEIAANAGATVTDELWSDHFSFVTFAVIAAAAALESDLWEIVHYGPGRDEAAKKLLESKADTPKKKRDLNFGNTIEHFAIILSYLGKPPLDPDSDLWPQTALLIELRNEILHYKSASRFQFNDQKRIAKLIAGLRALNHKAPPFRTGDSLPDIPFNLLSADCAAWASETAVRSLVEFHSLLGIPR